MATPLLLMNKILTHFFTYVQFTPHRLVHDVRGSGPVKTPI